jgi:hypothetical protein
MNPLAHRLEAGRLMVIDQKQFLDFLPDFVRFADEPFAEHIAKFEGLSEQQRAILLLDLLGRELRIELPSVSVSACA